MTTETKTKTVELAVLDIHGAWELIDDYGTVEEAKAEARQIARSNTNPSLAHADGSVSFGISTDPDSGSYEIDFRVYDDGTEYCQ